MYTPPADAVDSKQLFQVLRTQIGVEQDALQNFRVQNFRGVKRNRSPFACGILVNLVAAALPGQ